MKRKSTKEEEGRIKEGKKGKKHEERKRTRVELWTLKKYSLKNISLHFFQPNKKKQRIKRERKNILFELFSLQMRIRNNKKNDSRRNR